MILYIEINSCDDSTLFQIEANELEAIFLVKLERLSYIASEYQFIKVYLTETELKRHNLIKENFKKV